MTIAALSSTTPTAQSQLTLAQAERVHAYAKRRYVLLRFAPLPVVVDYLDADRVRCINIDRSELLQIHLAASACIDAFNGEGWQHLAEHEDELFELIEGRRDNPCWYAVLRGAA